MTLITRWAALVKWSSPKLPAALSLLVLLVVLMIAMVREFAWSSDDMVYFAPAEVVLGGESHPLLDKLRDNPNLALDDIMGFLPKRRHYQPKKRLFVSRHEVTNGQYQQFLSKIGSQPQSIANFAHPDINTNHNFRPASLRDIKYNGRQQPIVNLDWHDAYAFCRFINMRLPTADEFEAVYRFEAKLRQPGEFDQPEQPATDNQAITREVIPRNVGSHPSQRGIFHDIIGNVMEWVQPEQGRHFLMGYSYKQYPKPNTAAYFYPFKRAYHAANDFENDYGLRCVYEVDHADFQLDNLPPATVARDGTSCWRTKSHLGKTEFDLVTQDNAFQAKHGNPFPNQLCELPQKSWSLGPDLDLTTVDLIHQNPLGNALYLLGPASQTVSLPAFWLDRREVSVSDYQRFVNTSKPAKKLHAHPETPTDIDHRPLNWAQQLQRQQPDNLDNLDNPLDNPLDNKSQPVTGVDWWSAFAYCSWQNKHLPFAAQWESAVGGIDGRIYAWGNDSQAAENIKDITPQGVSGLSREVSEWTASFMAGSDAAVVKGGSDFFDWRVFGRAYVELKLPRHIKSPAVGFRCAKSA